MRCSISLSKTRATCLLAYLGARFSALLLVFCFLPDIFGSETGPPVTGMDVGSAFQCKPSGDVLEAKVWRLDARIKGETKERGET
jgi:hypothetical protein